MQYDDNIQVNKTSKKSKSKEEFFGKEYKGVKGQAAIDKLLEEKNGHVKAAFHRKEVGDIDLAWGDESGGLGHTIKRRDEMKAKKKGTISGLEMVNKIPEIIDNGDFDIDSLNRPGFVFDGCRVAIRPAFDGEKLNWIVSAMENFK